MSKQFYQVKMLFQPNPQMKTPWRPCFIFFESDWSIKGLAIFTSFENADGFRMTLENQFSHVAEVAPVDIKELLDILLEQFHGDQAKVLYDTAVYLDPTGLHCKGISPDFGSFQKFMLKNTPDEIPWVYDFVSIAQHKGHTAMMLQDKQSLQYSCIGVKGNFEIMADVYEALDVMSGTTEEKNFYKTHPNSSREQAALEMKEWIDRRAGK